LPDVEVAAVCNSAAQGLDPDRYQQTPAGFPGCGNAGQDRFEMLEGLTAIHFNVIFTTAFNQYALRAIKLAPWTI